MRNMKFWRTALVATLVLTVMLSVTGGTIAWFTDSVASDSNIIKSGTLDVEMSWIDNKADPNGETTEWKDASQGAIFDNDLWEPGYTEVRHIKISNEGTLALKYQLNIEAKGEVSDLADVIDVYYMDPAEQITGRDQLTEANKLGTLTNVLAGFSADAAGELLPGDSDTVTIALKMQESAGNEYQNKAIGSDFAVQLLATQLSYEEDSFDEEYDAEATYPVANSQELADVLKNAAPGTEILLAAGEYQLPTMYAKQSDITIKGDGDTKITGNTNSSYTNITFENVEFTGNIKARFNGNSSIKGCTFTDAGVTPSCYVPANSTLTIEGCTFIVPKGQAAIHFGGNDGGNIVMSDCNFVGGYVTFGKGMNVTFENCEFNGASASCYGSYTFKNCTFDEAAMVYIHANTGATSVTITMTGCSVTGNNNKEVKDICYNNGNSNSGTKKFVIDGMTYNHDELQAFPSSN